MVPTLEPAAIQDLIQEKNARLSRYLQKCESCWLLLVADGFKASGSIDLGAAVPHHAFRSSFDRIFILQVFGSELLRLVVAPPSDDA
jgi:hypothetical protein